MFSGTSEGFVFGDKHYQWHNPKNQELLSDLYDLYIEEGVFMPYTLEDYYQERVNPFIESLPPEDRLRGLLPEVVLKQFSLEERLKGLSPHEVFKQFPPNVIEEYLIITDLGVNNVLKYAINFFFIRHDNT